MINILITLSQISIVFLVVFWALRKIVSFSSRGRKKMKLHYYFPLLLYLLLTTIFARPLLTFLGPCQIEVLYGPLGNHIVYWIYPSLNIGFVFVCVLTILLLLTNWEAVIKFSDKILFLAPMAAFLSTIAGKLLLPGANFSPAAIKPLVCWLLFMLITYGMLTLIVIRDLRKQFQKTLSPKYAKEEHPPGKGGKKLLLIYPVANLSSGFGKTMYLRLPPLSLGILSALTPRDQFQVELIDEQFEPFAYREADLVAITAFTAHACRAYEIAAIYRKKGIPVVMGGIHASMRAEEALQFVDSVVVGEAEEIWPAVLQDFLKGSLKAVYQGTYPELSNCVLPDRDIFHKEYLLNTIQTSRGCPQNCVFCSVTRFNGRRYRQRPAEEVLDELETIPQMIARTEFVIKKIDVMQQTRLTPMPGTQLYKKLCRENRMIYIDYPGDWDHYNVFTLTNIPGNMSARKFLTTYRHCMQKSYSLFTLWWKALFTLFRTRRIDVAAGALRLNFGYRSFTRSNLENQMQRLNTRLENKKIHTGNPCES